MGISIWPANEIPLDMNCVMAEAEKVLRLKSCRSMSALSPLRIAILKKAASRIKEISKDAGAEALA